MSTCTPYLDCNNKAEGWESLLKRLIVVQPDGSLAVRTCCADSTPEPSPEPGPLILVYDSVRNMPVLDPNDVAEWNFQIDLPANGTVFTSVEITDVSTVNLYGATDITFKESLFDSQSGILAVDDQASCVTECERLAFNNCTALETVNLPVCLAVGESCFNTCTSLIELDLPLCEALGTTAGSDDVFLDIIGNTIDVTIHTSVLTCWVGGPDGDLCILDLNNTLTVNGGALVGCLH